jgi:filamentous hemagglutinin family protein
MKRIKDKCSASNLFAARTMFLAVAAVFADAANAQSLPTGGTATRGSATISTPTAASMVVNQTTPRAIIDWASFNIGNGASVTFSQPGASSIAVNRVGAAASASAIDGMLSANGHVMILNPNGVMFGATASVNVGGLIASTGNINDTQFMSGGSFAITGATGGSVSNAAAPATAHPERGITVTSAGLAAFVAPSVSNSGTITATSGRIVLASAEAATISMNNGLYEIAVTQAASAGTAGNTGTLQALGSGGTVILSAGDAANLISGTINLEGIQQATKIQVDGEHVVLKSDLNAPAVTGSSRTIEVCGCAQIQDAIDIAATGASISVAAGTYTQSSTLNVNKSVALSGAGESQTTIDARTVSGYGMLVTADHVSLSDFTLYGPTANVGSSYGIKVQPAGAAASSRLLDFKITNLTSRGAGRAELDLNGVVGATIDHVTANGAPVGNDSGTTAGAGIQVTDSADVTIKNSATRNNAWGGVALFQSNRFFDQQTTNITVQSNNSFTESNPLYLQDESASRNFGALALLGFNYAVRNSDVASGNSQFTWMQPTSQGAFDLAVNLLNPGLSFTQAWNGTALTQNFHVGVGHLSAGGTRSMSIMAAIDQAATGATVNVYPGSYTEIAAGRALGIDGIYDLGLLIDKDSLILRGVDAAGTTITNANNVQAWITAGASTNFGMNHGVIADNVTVEGLGFKPYAANANKTIEIAGDNFTFRNSVVDNRTASGGAGALYFGELIAGAAGEITRLTVTGSKFLDGSVSIQNGVGVASDGVNQPASDRVISNNTFVGSGNYRFGGLLLTGKMDEIPWRPLPIAAATVTGNSFSSFDDSVLVRGEQQGVDLKQIMLANSFDRAVLVTDSAGNARGELYASSPSGSAPFTMRSKYSIQSSVQAGVNRAVNGDTVSVGSGTYAEQLTIAKSLSLLGAGAGSTTIAPTSLVADSAGMRNILTIGGGPATNVELSGFTLKGPVPQINTGIFVRDGARANIHDNRLIDIRESTLLSGNQQGVGILVGRALLNTSGTAVIANNAITGYQKGGIVVDGPGSQGTIAGNTVTGEGPTGVTAQNGIQISRGASATVTGNTVSGNYYSGVHQSLDDEAAGILIFASGSYLNQGNITVGANNITGNEAGIWTNDPRTLTTIGLAGVSGNAHNAVASFRGGYAGEGSLLDYPAWAASNTALVNATTFGGTQSGDIVDAGGALRVSGWSGFSAIQPAVDAVASGGAVNVNAGTYAENVVVGGLRNLTFGGSTLHGLTINSGAAGSGIGGSATADGAMGFSFNAPVVLLSNTTLSTMGANIAFNGDIQNSGMSPFALTLRGSSGDITLVSGGMQGNPLGRLDTASNNFMLASTLWVTDFKLNTLGLAALSNHTLRAVGSGSTSTITAGGDVTGSTVSNNAVQIRSAGDVAASVTAPTASIEAVGNVQVVLHTDTAVVHAGGSADLSGSSSSIDVAASGGSVNGNFGQINNVGSSLIEVNGRPQIPASLSASADNSRVVPSETTLSGNTGASSGDARDSRSADEARAARGQIVRSAPARASVLLDRGLSVEIDLTPRNDSK